MYIPSFNAMTDQESILAFMKRFSFATLVTCTDNRPVATHLPFLISQRDGKIRLTAHFAKANPQWKDLEKGTNLVIFTEPHAYISPSHYEHERNVPTWNYISVHAYGKGRLIEEQQQVYEVLQQTISFYEPAYLQQWEKLSKDYQLNMMKGIVAFTIEVSEMQAKKKISQNRSQTEKENIIRTLEKSEHSNEQLIAAYMKEE